MDNIIFLGNLYPDGYIEELLEKGSPIDFPAHNLQTALLSGMIQCNVPVTVVTAVNRARFPHLRPLVLPDRQSSFVSGKLNGVMTGGVNYPVVCLLSQYIRFRKALKRVLRADGGNVVIVYGLTSSRLLAIRALRKKYRIKTVLIVPDLPEFMRGNGNKLYRFLKRMDSELLRKAERIVDGYVLLSPLMKEKLNVGDKPWIQMEGVYDDTVTYPSQEKSRVKSILYTGKTEFRHGILDLLDAFSMIDNPDYELWIRGNGPADKEIASRAAKDGRITIFPRMGKSEVVALQKKATVLVNPNHSYEEFTKYFFPSKIIEYMGSGTPAVMSRLACLPEEYNGYLYFFDDESAAGMAKKLVEICEKPQTELDAFGAAAREFVVRRANGKAQARRILEWLEFNETAKY